MRDADLRKDLGSIQTPTLILHGTDDRLCPFDLGKKMNEGIKGSQLIAVENAGHGFYYEEREKVNSELVRLGKIPEVSKVFIKIKSHTIYAQWVNPWYAFVSSKIYHILLSSITIVFYNIMIYE